MRNLHQTSVHIQSLETSSRVGISSFLAICHHIWKIEDVTEIHVLWCWCIFWRGIADPSCMGKGMDTGHEVVNVHGCISTSLGLVLPSEYHHLIELLGSVLHLLLHG